VEPVRWSTKTDPRGPMSLLEIDGDCPREVGVEREDALWTALHPDEQLEWDGIGIVKRPGKEEVRSDRSHSRSC